MLQLEWPLVLLLLRVGRRHADHVASVLALVAVGTGRVVCAGPGAVALGAVLEALADGSINQGHYQNYMKLRKESEFNQMSYLEKKQRDKQFGKMVKSVLKNKKMKR